MSDQNEPDWQRAHLDAFLADDGNKARLLAYARRFMTRALNTDAEDLVQDAALAITKTMLKGKFNYQGDLALMGYFRCCISSAFSKRCQKSLGTKRAPESNDHSIPEQASKPQRPTVTNMEFDFGHYVDHLGTTPIDKACVNELEDQLHAIINGLPQNHSEAITGEFWHDETSIETAERLGRSQYSVENSRKRARIEIRRHLDR